MAALRRAQDDRVLPLAGVVASPEHARLTHPCRYQSPQRCPDTQRSEVVKSTWARWRGYAVSYRRADVSPLSGGVSR